MVVLLPHTAPDGTTVLVNQVEGRRTPEQLAEQAEAARHARVVVNHTTGEVRRACDGVVLQQTKSEAQDTQE
ncbi:MAG: hypothetical protein PeribacterA2_0287 [Candidatus Peribacter riflensis]|uniref:Uncharacterized protein n=1 Tax=Candidatus Peribacter riflensis TaxID=1735162 RepID=A0A0S1SN36_9BACT|nr:MAG: hypothetical protein PeribacterA2_0287 [Candidatus Peribacter riflensis]OGJ78255.1 MAG: hypothetical protein A2398_05195 [Candidatus Peribacteria bacterium RIFOXYB1_FULL_57_12]OGJ83110.1 MAG: hypothetical protein A2412_01400 [Candidatus Peribacteria bacterium RIFOXYC1_FULL_58_8]ALM10781.1 MAG: hypothetical protein PeribacterB2_0287 [Candidatus Peribacter riflensis]ALM11883.1 MAG: hypothetical protein PeribacterC2_0286 [Candidatus Peribacter riflensis]